MRITDKLLSPHEEKLINLFCQSAEWRILKKLIDNNIQNMYQVGMYKPESYDEYLGYRFTIGELQRFKQTIKTIADRVERKKKRKKNDNIKK